jgi:hypothetical protein
VAEHRPPAAPASFGEAAADVRALAYRDDLSVREIPAPTGLAPNAIALAGDVRPESEGAESLYGTGRFILLHDPGEPAPWNGSWRVVCFAQAPLETDIGVDPMLADVAWSWLMDALASRRAPFHSASGTATKTISKGFGSLAAEGDGAQIELRASWSPRGPLAPHVEAWAELVCMLAGLPPGSEGVSMLGKRRSTRG